MTRLDYAGLLEVLSWGMGLDDDHTMVIATADKIQEEVICPIEGWLQEGNARLQQRLNDAEHVIAMIGCSGSAPHEERDKYERLYGRVAD